MAGHTYASAQPIFIPLYDVYNLLRSFWLHEN